MYKGNKNEFGESDLATMEKRRESQSYIRDPDLVTDVMHEGNTRSGWILYNTYCAACHQGNGKGDNNRFPPLKDTEWVTGDEDRLIDVVLNGLQGEITVNERRYNGLMPPHQHLDDFAIASILTYVRKEFGNEASPINSKKVSEIRHISTNKEK